MNSRIDIRRNDMYSKFGIKNEILELSKEVEKECEAQFKKIEQNC